MVMQRRRILQAIPALPMLASSAAAHASTTDLVLNCDPALVPPMANASEDFYRLAGVRIRVFATGPGLLLPQLARDVQNDLICTQAQAIKDAVRAGLVGDGARRGLWRNRLVIAVRKGEGRAAAKGRVAVSDVNPGSDMDGPAILRRLGLAPSAVLGVVDTDEVAFLLRRGDADAGLLHATDVRASPELAVLSVVPDGAAPAIVYSVAVTKLASRPNPDAFVAFLVSPECVAALREQGLEIVA